MARGRAVGWRKHPDVTDEDLAALYAGLCSIPAVSRRTGIPWTTVRDRLVAAGVTLRPKGAREGPYDRGGRVSDVEREAQLAAVRALMTAAPGVSVREIAEHTGMAPQLARNRHDAVQVEMVGRLMEERPGITVDGVARELSMRLDVAARRLASAREALLVRSGIAIPEGEASRQATLVGTLWSSEQDILTALVRLAYATHQDGLRDETS